MIRSIFVLLCLFASSCGTSQEVATTSPYTKEQLRDFEIRAARNDLTALRELELHYGFEGNEVARQNIYQRRLALRDPDALSEEVMRLVLSAKNLKDCNSKEKILNNAMVVAKAVAKLYEVKDILTDSDVKLVQYELDKLEC